MPGEELERRRLHLVERGVRAQRRDQVCHAGRLS
jgi:hypothetical protein